MHDPKMIRNVAIIAHIDHGKTTLLDGLLSQANIFRDDQSVPVRVMDSYDQEKERGITIFAKQTSIMYGKYKFNLIDTPGHADFSGEVERVLGMVNSVLLIVDAKEGPMPQTRFVLAKALQMGLRPLVILNKMDRPNVDPERVLNETFDLFVELGATDAQLDFAFCYASGFKGYAFRHPGDEEKDFRPLLDLIVDAVPAPTGDTEAPFLMHSISVAYDPYLGKQACGRIIRGSIKKNDPVIHINAKGEEKRYQIQKVEGFFGLEKKEMDEAGVGDIILLSGIPDVTIGDTVTSPDDVVHLSPIKIDEPTVSVNVWANNGPFAGLSGKHVTMNKIRERLEHEKKANISYEIDVEDQKKITVAGRGELHLAVLFEAMRREGYEFCLSKPQAITKQIDGQLCEPMQKVHVEVPDEYSGAVIEQLSRRKGEMQLLSVNDQSIASLEFLIPTRGLMGYRNEFLTSTRGLGILTSIFDGYAPWKGDIAHRQRGVLISICQGKINGYACFNLESRGTLFVKPGDDVYEGMIVGEHSRDNDLGVNPIKAKQLTNVRASGSDEAITLTPPKTFNLEQAINFIESDEWIEVTPDELRFRKIFLTENERKRNARK